MEDGSIPIIVIFPSYDSVREYQTDGIKQYAPLLAHLDFTGMAYVDLMEVLEEQHAGDVFDGHLSPMGSQLVAKRLLSALKDVAQ